MRVVRRPARPCWSIEYCQDRIFFYRERVMAAMPLLEPKQSAVHGLEPLRLAVDLPSYALVPGAGRSCDRQGEKSCPGPDDVLDPRAMSTFSHITLTHPHTNTTGGDTDAWRLEHHLKPTRKAPGPAKLPVVAAAQQRFSAGRRLKMLLPKTARTDPRPGRRGRRHRQAGGAASHTARPLRRLA